MRNNYLVEHDLIYFRRAEKDDNMEEIAKLIYDTDPYIYPYWFDNDINKCIEFFRKEMLEEGFIFNYKSSFRENLFVLTKPLLLDLLMAT